MLEKLGWVGLVSPETVESISFFIVFLYYITLFIFSLNFLSLDLILILASISSSYYLFGIVVFIFVGN